MMIALALLAKERNTLGDLYTVVVEDRCSYLYASRYTNDCGREWINCLVLCPASLGRFTVLDQLT